MLYIHWEKSRNPDWTQVMTPIQIIFPPQFEPFQPYLSGPYLKALLANCGVEASVFDANIAFYEWLISKAHSSVPWLIASNESADYLGEHVESAVELLQLAPQSLPQYRWAIDVVDEYLRAISPEGVKIGLTYLKVGNRYSSADLRAYLDRPDDIFRRYFEHEAESILGPDDVSTYLLSLVVIDQLPATVALTRGIKRRRPNARVIIGGPLVSRLNRQLGEVSWISQTFDGIVPGEGYRVLPSVLGIPQVYTGHVTPDFSDLNLDRYWSCRRVLPYIVAHGCNWAKCMFCSHHLTYDGYRASLISEVISDLEGLKQKHNAEYISFSDEYLTPVQLDGLSTGLMQGRLDLKWSTFARAEAEFCDQEFMSKLYAAGCRMLMFGLESASQRITNAMRKGTRVDHYRGIIEACKKANIAVRLDFMIGFPGEMEEDALATYDFIRQNRDVIDTPFSSYAVGIFELRSGIPVLEAADQFGILRRSPLRGDLDDQYEFESFSGLSNEARIKWREELIRFSKLQLGIEMVAPQNKTHQLILKDLYDQGLLHLPMLRISPDCYAFTKAELVRGVELIEGSGALRVVNRANGGEIEISPQLSQVLHRFKTGSTLADAFQLQTIWNEQQFARFADFLMRNDYIHICFDRDTTCQVAQNEREACNV